MRLVRSVLDGFVFGPCGMGKGGAAGGLERSEIETQSPPRRSFCGATSRTRFLTGLSPRLVNSASSKLLAKERIARIQNKIFVRVVSRRCARHTLAYITYKLI